MNSDFHSVVTYLNTVKGVLTAVITARTFQTFHMKAVTIEASDRDYPITAGTGGLSEVHASPVSSYKLFAVLLPVHLKGF